MKSDFYKVFDIPICNEPTIPDYELQALKDLYDSTDGDKWDYIYRRKWNFKTKPCSVDTTWFGLSCSYDSNSDFYHVIQIDLNNVNLHGTLPHSLGDLSELTSLLLYYNQLSGSIPSSLGQLTKLTDLYLSDNLFTGTIPDSFGLLSELTSFYLDDNLLIGTIPSSLCNNHEEYFNFQYNKFDCYPSCMKSDLYTVYVDDIPLCKHDPTDNNAYVATRKRSKSMIIVWIIISILFVVIIGISMYVYNTRNAKINPHDSSIEMLDRSSQYVEGNYNINNNEENDNNEDVNMERDIYSTGEAPETLLRLGPGITVPSNDDANVYEQLHQHRTREYIYSRNIEPWNILIYDQSNNNSTRNHTEISSHSRLNDENNFEAIRSYDQARRRMNILDEDYGYSRGNHNKRSRRSNRSNRYHHTDSNFRGRNDDDINHTRRRIDESDDINIHRVHRNHRRVQSNRNQVPISIEPVIAVAGTMATDHDILNLPTAIANVDLDVIYVDPFIDV